MIRRYFYTSGGETFATDYLMTHVFLWKVEINSGDGEPQKTTFQVIR